MLRHAVLVGVGLLCSGDLAWSAHPPEPAGDSRGRLAFVRMSDVVDQCQAMLKLKSAMDTKRTQTLAILQKDEQNLRHMEQALQAAARAGTRPDDLVKQRKAFDQAVQKLRQKADLEKRAFESAYEKGVQDIHKTIQVVLETLMKEQSFGLILEGSSVLRASPGLDLTPVVLEQTNARLPQVAHLCPDGESGS
jgi:Skp family chaperone for outer membrane proteins